MDSAADIYKMPGEEYDLVYCRVPLLHDSPAAIVEIL